MTTLFSWSTVGLVVIWFVAGVVLGWNRGIGSALYAAVAAASVPAIVFVVASALGGSPLHNLVRGSGVLAYAALGAMTLASAVFGGYVAVRLNPVRRHLFRARTIEAEIRGRLGGLNSELHDVTTSGRVVADQQLLRARIAAKENELREIRRLLSRNSVGVA